MLASTSNSLLSLANPPTARRAVAAYGGEERWREASTVEAELSAWGLAFRLKGRSPMRRVRVRAKVWQPEIRLHPYGKAGRTAVLEGFEVRIENADKEVLKRRTNGRSHFPSFRRRLWWDDLDQAYFAGYALWNYLTLPALLIRTDVDWTELSPGRLEGIFPPHLPTHCRTQRFEFDIESSLLRQHDYTAEVIGKRAIAAHLVVGHDEWSGIQYPSRRRVTPRAHDGRPRKRPLLVGIDVHRWQLA